MREREKKERVLVSVTSTHSESGRSGGGIAREGTFHAALPMRVMMISPIRTLRRDHMRNLGTSSFALIGPTWQSHFHPRRDKKRKQGRESESWHESTHLNEICRGLEKKRNRPAIQEGFRRRHIREEVLTPESREVLVYRRQRTGERSRQYRRRLRNSW